MSKPPLYSILFICSMVLLSFRLVAQQTAPATRGYSLQQAIDYALANNVTIKNQLVCRN